MLKDTDVFVVQVHRFKRPISSYMLQESFLVSKLQDSKERCKKTLDFSQRSYLSFYSTYLSCISSIYAPHEDDLSYLA